MGWRLGGWKVRRLKKGMEVFASSFMASWLPSFPAFYLRTYNTSTIAAQRRITERGAVFQHPGRWWDHGMPKVPV
jgi:hypothetical protein